MEFRIYSVSMIDITIGILKLRKRKKYKYDGIDGI